VFTARSDRVLEKSLRFVLKGLKEYLEDVREKRPIDSMQKTAVLGSLHVTGIVVQLET